MAWCPMAWSPTTQGKQLLGCTTTCSGRTAAAQMMLIMLWQVGCPGFKNLEVVEGSDLGSSALACTGPARLGPGLALIMKGHAWSQGVASSKAPALTAERRPCRRRRGDVTLPCLWFSCCRCQLHPEAEAPLVPDSPVFLSVGQAVTKVLHPGWSQGCTEGQSWQTEGWLKTGIEVEQASPFADCRAGSEQAGGHA